MLTPGHRRAYSTSVSLSVTQQTLATTFERALAKRTVQASSSGSCSPPASCPILVASDGCAGKHLAPHLRFNARAVLRHVLTRAMVQAPVHGSMALACDLALQTGLTTLLLLAAGPAQPGVNLTSPVLPRVPQPLLGLDKPHFEQVGVRLGQPGGGRAPSGRWPATEAPALERRRPCGCRRSRTMRWE